MTRAGEKPRRRRRTIVAVLAAVAVVGAAVVLLFRGWIGTDAARHAVERILSEAIHRTVTIDALDVGAGDVTLRGVAVAEPEGFGDEPLLRADRIGLEVSLDELLDRKVVGNVRATGLTLRAVKLGGRTNLAGMIEPGHGPAIDLHLDVVLEGSRVVLEDRDGGETLELRGVGIRMLLSNREAERRAEVSATVARLDLHGVEVRDVEVELIAHTEAVVVSRLSGTVAESGSITGSGRVELGDDGRWSFDLRAASVPLRDPVLEVITALFPRLRRRWAMDEGSRGPSPRRRPCPGRASTGRASPRRWRVAGP